MQAVPRAAAASSRRTVYRFLIVLVFSAPALTAAHCRSSERRDDPCRTSFPTYLDYLPLASPAPDLDHDGIPDVALAVRNVPWQDVSQIVVHGYSSVTGQQVHSWTTPPLRFLVASVEAIDLWFVAAGEEPVGVLALAHLLGRAGHATGVCYWMAGEQQARRCTEFMGFAPQVGGVSVGDINGDGLPEVVAILGPCDELRCPGAVYLLDSAGGTPKRLLSLRQCGAGRRVARLPDLDGDRIAEVAVACPGSRTQHEADRGDLVAVVSPREGKEVSRPQRRELHVGLVYSLVGPGAWAPAGGAGRGLALYGVLVYGADFTGPFHQLGYRAASFLPTLYVYHAPRGELAGRFELDLEATPVIADATVLGGTQRDACPLLVVWSMALDSLCGARLDAISMCNGSKVWSRAAPDVHVFRPSRYVEAIGDVDRDGVDDLVWMCSPADPAGWMGARVCLSSGADGRVVHEW